MLQWFVIKAAKLFAFLSTTLVERIETKDIYATYQAYILKSPQLYRYHSRLCMYLLNMLLFCCSILIGSFCFNKNLTEHLCLAFAKIKKHRKLFLVAKGKKAKLQNSFRIIKCPRLTPRQGHDFIRLGLGLKRPNVIFL